MAAAISTQFYNRAPVYVVDPEAASQFLKRRIFDVEGIELAAVFHLLRYAGLTARSRGDRRVLLDCRRAHTDPRRYVTTAANNTWSLRRHSDSL